MLFLLIVQITQITQITQIITQSIQITQKKTQKKFCLLRKSTYLCTRYQDKALA